MSFSMPSGRKKTWLIFAAADCTRDHTVEELDLPPDKAHPGPEGYQSERRRLQAAYRAKVQGGEHLWHEATNDDQVALRVEQLKDELAVLRRRFQQWQRLVLVVLFVLLVVTTGLWWSVVRRPAEMARQLGVVKPKVPEPIDLGYIQIGHRGCAWG
jgi:hypothetical protein